MGLFEGSSGLYLKIKNLFLYAFSVAERLGSNSSMWLGFVIPLIVAVIDSKKF